LDIKPHNILVDIHTKRIKLIDFGSADFYIPHKRNRLNVKQRIFSLILNIFQVYSRFMKPPEILLGNEFYNLTADIWAAGVIFTGLVINNILRIV